MKDHVIRLWMPEAISRDIYRIYPTHACGYYITVPHLTVRPSLLVINSAIPLAPGIVGVTHERRERRPGRGEDDRSCHDRKLNMTATRLLRREAAFRSSL